MVVKTMRILLQTNQSDCLLACAAMIMDSYGYRVPVYRLVEKIQLSRAGSNILQLKEVLKNIGFKVDGYHLELAQLHRVQMPVIAYVQNGHFIVLNKVNDKRVIAIDPAIGKIAYSYEEFKTIYSGVIIKIEKIGNAAKSNKARELRLLDFLEDKKVIRVLSGLLLTSICTQAVATSYSYIYASLGNGSTYSKLFLLVCLAVLMLGIGSIVQGVLTKKFNLLYEQIYGNGLVDSLVSKNYKFYMYHSNGDLLYRINSRGTIKDAFILRLIPSFISLCAVILIELNILFRSLLLGTLLLGASVIYLILYVFIGTMIYTESNKYTQKVIKLNTTSENIVRTISTIKVLDVGKVFMKKWHTENVEQAEMYGHLVMIQSVQTVISNIFGYIVPIAISIINIIFDSDETVYYQFALLPLLYLVVQNVMAIGQAFTSIYTVLPNIDKMNEVLDEQFMIERKLNYTELNEDEIIVVNNMSYYYGGFLCLKNVNLHINKGKKYAVIGVSGSGKSTLLKVLANLLNDYQGEVSFNLKNGDKPIYLDQETSILDGTISENVTFGQECTKERLIEISNVTGIDEVVNMQQQKWGAEISKGKNLSRGQEQRICLARCLIKDADIYLLDEATSNIDVVDEDKIMNNLLGVKGILQDKTVFISTHKLSMIKYVDEIIYIEDGTVHQGRHEEFLQTLPLYKAFFDKSSAGV